MLKLNNRKEMCKMKSISVIVGKNAKYSIDLKDEYQSEEFINFFEEQLQIMCLSGKAA